MMCIPSARSCGLGAVLAVVLAAPAPNARFQQPPDSQGGFGRIVPVATTARERSLASFLDTLRKVARQRDAAALLRLVVDDVAVGFSDAQGHKAFSDKFKLSDPRSSFWHDLEWLLSIGASYLEWGDYYLPYAHTKLPAELDLRYGVIVRPRVPMRAEPSARAAVITTLSYDIVKLDFSIERAYDDYSDEHGEHGAPWIKIALANGRRGYVERDSIWPSAGPRLCIGKIDGQWRITEYAVGD